MQGSANLNVMIKAARKAGRSLAKDFREVENLQVSTKGAGDFVSRADIAAEAVLKEELMGARPTYGWLAEEGGEVAGYATSSPFHERAAYSTAVATSIYLANSATGHGLGTYLYTSLLKKLESEAGLHRAYGGIALPNPKSVALHQRLGFKKVARYSEVGFKFGKYWDVVWLERPLS